MSEINDLIPSLQNQFSIVLIGCGGIVNDAHLPAYKIAGYDIEGVFDRNLEKAKKTAEKFRIQKCFSDEKEMFSLWNERIIFDIAVPANHIDEILEILPEKSAVLIQKPFGENLAHAKKLMKLCARKKLRAAVNFQLRYAPNILKIREMITTGILGEIRDIEVRITCHTPWNLWSFLYGIPRIEILYHSIHYIDLIRSFCGMPDGVFAKTIGTPEMDQIKNCRSAIIMDYGNETRATISTNHLHGYGNQREESYFKCEGTKGAVFANMGINLDYPKGKPDFLEYYDLANSKKGWQAIPIVGNWFPHAFIGSMGSVLKAEDGQIKSPATCVEDAFETMSVVEAAYISSEQGGISPERYSP